MFHPVGTSRRAHFGFAATVTLALFSTLLSQPSSAQEPLAAPAAVQQTALASAPAEEVGLVPEPATATSNTYRQSDGSMRLESFTEPVNYLNDDESWIPIDNELVPAPGAAYEVMNAGNSFEAKIPADASTTPVRFATEDAWVSMRMHGLDDAPSVDGEVATFEDVDDADEVTYEVTNTGLKEDILLEQAPSSANGALQYTYSLDASAGITPAMGLEGSIEFRNPAGEAVVVMPAAYMFDSASPEPVTSHNVTYDLIPAGAGWELRVTPSMEWLQDAARVYPVTIDPTLGNAPASKDCWIRDTTPTATACGDTATYVKVGRSSGPVNYRGLIDFDTSSIPTNATLTSAEVPLYIDHTQSTSAVTGDYALFRAGGVFSGSSATWNSSGASGAWDGGSPGAMAYGTLYLNGSTSGFRIFGGNLKDLIQSWVTNPNNKTGLVLKQASSPTLNVLSFHSSAPAASNDNKRPRLNVNYSVPPIPPTDVHVTPGGAGYTSSLSPSFVAELPAPGLRASFQIRVGSTLVWSGTSPTPSGTTATLPYPGSLHAGQSYELSAQTVGPDSASSFTTVTFQVDAYVAILPAPVCGANCVTNPPVALLEDVVLQPSEVRILDLTPSLGSGEGVDTYRYNLAISNWAGTGSLSVYDPDYAVPVMPTFTTSSPDSPAVGKSSTMEVPASLDNQIGLQNLSASPITVSLAQTGTRRWPPQTDPAEPFDPSAPVDPVDTPAGTNYDCAHVIGQFGGTGIPATLGCEDPYSTPVPPEQIPESTVPAVPINYVEGGGAPPAPEAALLNSAAGIDAANQRVVAGRGNTYTCYYSGYNVYGYSGSKSALLTQGSRKTKTGPVIYGAQDLRKGGGFFGSHAESGYHTYVGVEIGLTDPFKAVSMRSQWGYVGNLELNPGYSIVTGFGDASADIQFTAHATQHKSGQNDLKSVAQLSSQNIDTAVKNYKMSANGSVGRSIALASGRKSVEFTFDMRAALSVDAPAGDAAEAAFQFGPRNDLYMKFSARQAWVYTLKRGYTLSSCG